MSIMTLVLPEDAYEHGSENPMAPNPYARGTDLHRAYLLGAVDAIAEEVEFLNPTIN